MFGFKKDDGAERTSKALAVIEEEINEINGKEYARYVRGLVEMAYILEAIDRNLRADLVEKIHNKQRAEQAKGEPIYKKKGVYEYRDYYIVKDFAREQETNECWCVMDKEQTDMFVKDVAFKECVKKIDELTEARQ